MTNAQSMSGPSRGDYVVQRPRASDAIGHSLRGVFAEMPLPDEMVRLLRQLDRVAG